MPRVECPLSESNSEYHEISARLERNLAKSAQASIAEVHLRRAEENQRMACAVAPSERRPYRVWDNDELAQLKSTIAAGSSFARLAARLGRTESAIRDKAFKMGLQTSQLHARVGSGSNGDSQPMPASI